MRLRDQNTILIVAPHPDDEAIGCGGLIATARESNGVSRARVVVSYLCVGPSPRQLVTGHTPTATRLEEIEQAAKLGGFEYRILYRNEQLQLDAIPQVKLIDAIEDLIAEVEPEVICLPFGDSYNQDHRAAFTAGVAALRPVPQAVRHLVPWVLEYEEPYSWGVGEKFQPNFYLPLSEVQLKGKLDLLACHQSQVRADPFPRSSQNLTRLAWLRGAEIGVEAAESYRVLRGVVE